MMSKVTKKKPVSTRTSSSRKRSGRPFGAHQSISGGLPKAVDRAIETGCDCMQIFTRNVNQWAVKPIEHDVATAFKEAVLAAKLKLVIAHDSYLINPASGDDTLRENQYKDS